MQKSDCFSLGKITKPHGLKGEVIIWLDVDMPENYENLDAVFLEIKGQLVPYLIEEIQVRGKKSIVKFEDINTIEMTEAIVDAAAFLPLKALPKLKGNQFYYHEVIGYELYDNMTQKSLGILKAIYESIGQDLFAIDIEESEILIPIVDNFIQSIDHTAKRISLDLPDGLIDIYLNPS